MNRISGSPTSSRTITCSGSLPYDRCRRRRVPARARLCLVCSISRAWPALSNHLLKKVEPWKQCKRGTALILSHNLLVAVLQSKRSKNRCENGIQLPPLRCHSERSEESGHGKSEYTHCKSGQMPPSSA